MFKEKLALLPSKPGCYIHKDKNGNVLLKADTQYMLKCEDVIDGKRYAVYDTETKDYELLVAINN